MEENSDYSLDEDVEELLESDEVDEYETNFDDKTEKRADFGSLMVSIRLVSHQVEEWTNKGYIPELYEIEKKEKMVKDALDETPIEELTPEDDGVDEEADEVVNYAKSLLNSLKKLKQTREKLEEVNSEVSQFRVENFELTDE